MRLIYKLMFLVVCIGGPLAVTAIVLTNITKEALELKIRERHLDIAKNFAAETESFFADYQKYISTFLYNYKASELDDKKLKNYLSSLMIQFEDIRILTVIGKDRKVRVQLLPQWDVSPTEITKHISLIDPEKVIAKSVIDVSDVYVDRGGSPLVTMTFAFPDRERVLSAEVSLKSVQDAIKAHVFERNETAFIVDGKGRMIVHSAPGKLKTLDDLTGMNIVKIIRGRTTSGVIDYMGREGKNMVGAYVKSDIGWMVVVRQESKDAYFMATRMKNIAMISVSVVVFLALVLGMIIARSIISPVYKLVMGAEEIGKGNINYKVGISSRDEVGYLAGAFDRMSASLSDREKSIENVSNAAKRVSAILDRDHMAGATLEAMGKITNAKTIAIMLPESREGLMKTYVMGNGHAGSGDNLSRSLESAAKIAMEQMSIIDTKKAVELKAAASPCDSIAIPIIFEGAAKGAILVDGNLSKEGFTATDLQLFGIITSSVAISVQNIELLEDTIMKSRMEEELKTAELVQKTFFPDKAPDIPGIDLSSFIESASETGGDWFGFVHEPENRRTAILIADVTGHGVPAALVTATTSSFFKTIELFRSYVGSRASRGRDDSSAAFLPDFDIFDPLSPDFMLRCLNEIILKSTKRRLVMTLFASVYYHDTRKLVYANAGHNPPMIFRKSGLPSNKKSKKLKQSGYLLASGIRLGDEEKVEFPEKTMQLMPGDAILWYTDGLTECENDKGEEFSERRLLKLFENVAENSIETIKNEILQTTGVFFGKTPHKDDITFIIGKVLEGEPLAAAPRAGAAAAQPAAARAKNEVMIVNSDKAFSRQFTWFLKSHGFENINHFKNPESAAGKIAEGEPDLCVIPIGAKPDDYALAVLIKEKHPRTKMIFTTSSPFNDVIPVLHQLDLPLRIIAEDSENLLPFMQIAALKLFRGRFWGVSHYIDRGSKIRRVSVSDTYNRVNDLRPLVDLSEKIGFSEYTVNRIITIADEMVTNAIYDAPRDEHGRAKYAEMSRPMRIDLGDREMPSIEFGSDSRHLAIGVTDYFGALDKKTLLKYLSGCILSGGKQREDKKGGAGLGLYMLYQMVDHFVINVDPGKKTEIICFIRSQTDVKYQSKSQSSFMYFSEGV